MGRVGIVSPLSVVPGCRIHLEEGRGRGALSVFLLVPDHDPGALPRALETLHDPRGPADLDQRLGELAADAPPGTSFLVALEQHVWVFPSPETQIRLLRGSEPEALDVPQVVRLAADDRVEVVAARTGEAVALAGFSEAPEPVRPPVRSAPRSFAPAAWIRSREWLRHPRTWIRNPGAPRSAAILAGSGALIVFALFRVIAATAPESGEPAPRSDAWVEPDLEGRVLGMVAGSEGSVKGAKAEGEKTDEGAKAEPNERGSETPRNPGPPPKEWSYRTRAPITSSPALAGGAVVFGSRDSTVYCLDAAGGEERWTLPAGSGVGSSPRIARGLVVFGTYAGRVLAADGKSGRVKWEGRTGGKIVASPCLLEGLAIVGSSDRRVHAFDLDSGEKTWAFETKGAIRASAEAIGSDRVVVGSTDGTIYAIDTAKGSTAWKRAAGASVVASAAFDEDADRVVVGTQDGTVLCLAAEDGAIVWRARVGSGVNGRPRIAESVVLVGTSKGTLLALDRRDGTVRWKVEGQKGFDATPAVVHDTVVAPSFDGTVLFVGLEKGDLRGKRSLGSRVWSSPASSSEVVYLGTFDGTFHALTLP